MVSITKLKKLLFANKIKVRSKFGEGLPFKNSFPSVKKREPYMRCAVSYKRVVRTVLRTCLYDAILPRCATGLG